MATINMKISQDLKDRATKKGLKRDLDLSGYIRYLIVEDLEKEKRKGGK